MERAERERTLVAQQRLMIERQLVPDFWDDSLEWRRLFSEIWGTFPLVLVAAGGGVVGTMSNGRVSLGMAVVVPGLMVMVIIYFMGPVSGAHFFCGLWSQSSFCHM